MFHTVNVLTFHTILAYILLFMQLFLKILSGIGNSVDPDQTLLQRRSYLGLYCLHILFCQKLWFRNFRTITDLEINRRHFQMQFFFAL